MRISLFVLLLFCFSCKSTPKQGKLSDTIAGNWLVIYPDHQLKGEWQRVIYGKIQDSIVTRKGLKLVSFSESGLFRQMDNLVTNGHWDANVTSDIYIDNGGEGFENFKTRFLSFDDEVLQLIETVNYQGEEFGLIWHFKKIDKKTSNKLFSSEANAWRMKPKQAETDAAIKNRLATILRYYVDYYNLIAQESSFFIGRRIILPLEFYQHAIGTKDFDPESDFANLFYNKEQAEKAYDFLANIVTMLRNDFVKNNNYVKGYAMHMATMAESIVTVP